MGVSDLGCNTIKHAVPRLRPEHSVVGTYYRDTGQWLRVPEGYQIDRVRDTSFPSAHAANSMALAVLAVLFWPKTRRVMMNSRKKTGHMPCFFVAQISVLVLMS